MELINLMFKYYIRTAERSFKLVIKNWPVMFALVIYSIILAVSGSIFYRFYMLGGFIMAIISASCSGSYLYLIQEVINSRVVTIYDFKNSFTAYLRKVLNAAFFLWIASMILNLLIGPLSRTPYGWLINIAVYAAAFIILNPLPEFIYQTYYYDLSLFGACYEFMKENFLEWLIPNIIFFAVLYFTSGFSLIPSVGNGIIGIGRFIIGLFVIFYGMIYRGILFRFLNESTRRSRLFKLRMLF